MNRRSFLDRHRFLILLVALGTLLSSYPVIESRSGLRYVFQAAFELVMITGLLAMHSSRRWVGLGLALVVPAVAIYWMPLVLPDSPLVGSPRVQCLGHVSMALFLLLLVVFVLRDLFESRDVTNDRLCGALCAYLLLGLTWGFLYIALELVEPGSYQIREGLQALDMTPGQHRVGSLFYFSFVTLTTLGYGDVTPLGSTAQTLVMWEAILGQAFLTIMVARLVGLHVTASTR